MDAAVGLEIVSNISESLRRPIAHLGLAPRGGVITPDDPILVTEPARPLLVITRTRVASVPAAKSPAVPAAIVAAIVAASITAAVAAIKVGSSGARHGGKDSQTNNSQRQQNFESSHVISPVSRHILDERGLRVPCF